MKLASKATNVVIVSVPIRTSVKNFITNTASVTPPVGTFDNNTLDNWSMDYNNITGGSDVNLTLSFPSTVIPGTPVIYSLMIYNSGPSDASDMNIVETFPSALVNMQWQCIPVIPLH